MNLVPLANWHNPTKRRVEAIRAAHERDETALWELLQAYMLTYGRKQALTSERTLKNYRIALRDFLEWAWPEGAKGPKVEILKATREDLARYVATLQLEGSHLEVMDGQGASLEPGTIALRIAGIRQFYKALEWAGAATLPQGIPTPRDPTPPEERRPALPPELYKKLLGYLSPTTEPEVLRDRIAVRLAGECGLRIAEVVGVQLEDLSLEERLVQVRGKGGKLRSVPLPKSLVIEIKEWLKLRQGLVVGDEKALLLRLFKGKRRAKALSERGLLWAISQHYVALEFPSRYRGVHMLRHSAGTRAYKVSKDLHATARLLGHSSPATSAIYAKMDLEGLFELVDAHEES